MGLVWMYLRSKAFRIPDGDGLPMEEDLEPDYLEWVLDALSQVCESVAYPQANDIILMKLPGGYTYLGAMVHEENMLHVLKDRPSGLEPIQMYRRRVAAVFRSKTWRLF